MLKKRTFGEFDPDNLCEDQTKRPKHELDPILESKEGDEVDADDVWNRAFGPIEKVEETPVDNNVEMEEELKDWNEEAEWGASDPFLITLVTDWFKQMDLASIFCEHKTSLPKRQ